jgi:1-deoxy-D-xylulose-5-phosphate synthase
MTDWKTEMKEIKIGTGRKLSAGSGGKDERAIAILSLGHPGNFAAAAIRELRTDGLNPAHYDMRFAKPLDEMLLHEVFQKFEKIITVEDGTVVGGFGSAVLEFMNLNNYKAEIKILGIPDRIVEHGTPAELHHECGYDMQAIKDAVLEMMKDSIAVKSTGQFE